MTHVPWHPEDVTYESDEEIEAVHGIDSVELRSVGIDIGTTTTHLLFSRLLARRDGSGYSSGFEVVEREETYRSPVTLTPYTDETTIDTDAIDAIVSDYYEDAGVTPGDVDTGAVIVTGEASRKENAAAIANLFSERYGTFVCATAGPDLEALMSAHGSGAVDRSVSEGVDLLHVDVGGGTTKFSYVVDGFVEETASINVGAHLVAFDEEGRVSTVEPAARRVAADVGVTLVPGEPLDEGDREAIAKRFADLIFEVVEDDLSSLGESLLVTDRPEPSAFDKLTFAGGVADYIFGDDPSYDGDLGVELGRALERRSRQYDVADLGTGIRATVIGSTQHKVQVSGNTITITDESVLPIRNLQMVPFVAEPAASDDDGHPDQDDHPPDDHTHEGHSERHAHDGYTGVDGDDLTRSVVEKLDRYEAGSLDEGFAFGFHLHGIPTYERLSSIADAVIRGWERFDGENEIVVAFDSDLAMSAGRLIADRVDVSVVVLDGVTLEQFGYIDVGEPLEDTAAVPVTVKSLLFEG